MPNQSNFRSDITTNTDPRFLASRVVSYPEEGILLEQVPASFGFSAYDNIEVHFYSVPDNALVLSTVMDANDADILKSHVVSYADGTLKNYIRIDFTALFQKKQLLLIPGDYRLVLNYFTEEIGDYNDRQLQLQIISPSRTEVQLAFNNNVDEVAIQQNMTSSREFVLTSLEQPFAVGAAEKIFVSGVKTEDPTEGLIYENIVANIEIPTIEQTYASTIGRVKNLGQAAEPSFQTAINEFLPKLYDVIREEIVSLGDARIQEDEFRAFIITAVDDKLKELQAATDTRITLN